jgi:hypothetical protein
MADETMVGGATKVATSVVGAMASTPLAIALLLVNAAFLVFTAWVLSIVAKNTVERNRTQTVFLEALVKDCLDFQQQLHGKTGYRLKDGATPESILKEAATP